MKRLSVMHGCGKWFLVLLPALPLAVGCSGCGDGDVEIDNEATTPIDDRWREELYTSAMQSLDHLEEFQSGTMRQRIIARIGKLETNPPDAKEDTLLAAWPEPEMLSQIIDRLNQWAEPQKSVPDWQVDPMVADLPAWLVESSPMDGLDSLRFGPFDGFALREAVWLHDASVWARGNRRNPVEQARRLFDWTIRNIELEERTSLWIPRFPWETLMFGQGTALERAWVFILLARQQGIDAALLALEDPSAEKASGPQSPQPWVVAVLGWEGPAVQAGQRGSEDESPRPALYLFEPALGLPIPAPDGLKLGPSGELIVQPATLDQVLQDDALLARLSPDKVKSYPLTASELRGKRIVVLVEGSPSYLAGRMKLVESHPKQRLVLTTSPDAQAKRFREASAHLAGARLWTFPFETLRTRSQLSPPRIGIRLRELLKFYADSSATLCTGRMLHIKGELSEAVDQYLQSFRSDDKLDAIHQQSIADFTEELRRNYRGAEEDQLRQAARELARDQQMVLRQARRDARYWLGLILQERGDYAAAIDYLAERTLNVSSNGSWTFGATYNLARCYESTGRHDRAIELYRLRAESPGYAGNLLRARWIESLLPGEADRGAGADEAEPDPATKAAAGSIRP